MVITLILPLSSLARALSLKVPNVVGVFPLKVKVLSLKVKPSGQSPSLTSVPPAHS
jgi:hypothetical protein